METFSRVLRSSIPSVLEIAVFEEKLWKAWCKIPVTGRGFS